MPATSLFASVGFGSSVCRRAKASSRWVSAAARAAAPCAAVDVALEIAEPALRQPRLQQLQAADDPGQQVVEVVRDAAGELADGLHLLRLEQLLARLPPAASAASRRSVMSRVILAKPISSPRRRGWRR